MNELVARGNDLNAVAYASPRFPDGAAEVRDDPRREIRIGLIVAGIFFVLFLGWAAFARLTTDLVTSDLTADDTHGTTGPQPVQDGARR